MSDAMRKYFGDCCFVLLGIYMMAKSEGFWFVIGLGILLISTYNLVDTFNEQDSSS